MTYFPIIAAVLLCSIALCATQNNLGRRPLQIFYAIALAIFVIASLSILLSSCARAASGRAQNLADAIAGQQAAVIVLDQAGLRLTTDTATTAKLLTDARVILGGAQGFTRAAAGGDPLPAPTIPPAAIAGDPGDYSAAGKKADSAANSSGFWSAVGAGSLVAVGLLLGVLKNAPGLAGIAGSVADGLWRAVAPARAKAQQADMETAAHTAERLVSAIEVTPNGATVGELKRKAMARVGSRANDWIIKQASVGRK